ncbi:DUF7519 family protein [Halorussus lipolyticus]|uniref:DUF7519 family protein n=1 Tax=Halorussus lipolyticus TaxID=3034024 RepID=UPI0023E8CC45|nr:hypothetical protein [Halorussus sp. DT80]
MNGRDSGGPERGATSFGGTVALVVTALVGIALGVAEGALWPTLGGLAGAVISALGVRAMQSEANARRAVGSVGVVVGASIFAGVAVVGGEAVALLVGISAAGAGINAIVSFDARVEQPAVEAVWRSATLLTVGAVVAVAVHLGMVGAMGRLAGAGVSGLLSASALALLVVLQVEIFVLAELMRLAVPILDRWLPENRDVRGATLARFDFRFEDAPRAYWAAFAAQVALALSSWGPRWFAVFLDLLSVLGRTVELLLTTGVLHVPLSVGILGLLGVLLARGLQALFVSWAGSDPPRAVALSAGGLVTLGVALVLGVWAGSETVVSSAGSGVANTVGNVGLAGVVAGAVATALFTVAAVRRALATVVAPWVATESATGFAIAGVALFVASLVVAEAGGSALAALAGVAGALVVHDLGTNAVGLGVQIGREAETRTGESAHAVGSLLVGAGGVALAGATAFVMGRVEFSVPAWRARLAVALLLVAVLCFAVLFERDE